MRRNILKLYIFLLFCTFSLINLCGSSRVFAIDHQEFQEALLEQLEYLPAELLGLEAHGFDSQRIDRMLADIYHEHGLQPFWVSADGPGKRAEVIFDTVRSAYREGLNPDAYRLSLIEKYWASRNAVGLARLDILLTLALGEYLADIREGRLNPRKVDPELFASARDEAITPGEGGEQEGWGMDRIREIVVSSRKRTVVPLKKPIPVHITYRTVWIGVDNTIRFGKDVYGRDKLLEKALYETVL
jgi:murein L,D-transpeptidase YcbB/YkuD